MHRLNLRPVVHADPAGHRQTVRMNVVGVRIDFAFRQKFRRLCVIPCERLQMPVPQDIEPCVAGMRNRNTVVIRQEAAGHAGSVPGKPFLVSRLKSANHLIGRPHGSFQEPFRF